jgi:Cytochrome oxidase complex assembly protein 1
MLGRTVNTTQNRPLGVTLLAVIFLWIGGFGTLLFPIIAFAGDMTWVWRTVLGSILQTEAGIRAASHVINTALFLAYVAYLVIGIGLWKLKNWARKAVLVIIALGGTGGLVAAIVVARQQPLIGIACATWCISNSGWIAWYLMRPRVRYAFGDWRKYTPAGVWIEPPALSKRGKIAVGIAVPVTTIGLFVTSLLFAVDSMMRNSAAYRMAIDDAQASPCVAAVLGTPLHGGSITGNYEENGERGSADYDFAVRGPKGKGYLSLEAKKSQGKWRINSLVLSHNAHDTPIVPAPTDSSCQ